MPGLFGGGGGQGAGGAVNQQPQAGQAQVYQPQNQPTFDLSYQNLLTQLYNPAMGGLQAMGNVSPAQQVYPQVQGVAGQIAQPGNVPGSYGSYGGTALATANNALNLGLNALNTGQTGLAYGPQAGQALTGALGGVNNAAFNPLYAQTIANIAN